MLRTLPEVLTDQWIDGFGGNLVVCGLDITAWSIGRRGAGVGGAGLGGGVPGSRRSRNGDYCTGVVNHLGTKTPEVGSPIALL